MVQGYFGNLRTGREVWSHIRPKAEMREFGMSDAVLKELAVF
jgi:hypothetical protein